MLSIRTKLAVTFGIALLFLATTGAFSWSSTVNLVDNAEMVDHTHEVLSNLEKILSQLKDAETGQRGFVLTGDPSYLAPYDAGLGGVVLAVANVRYLTSDNSSQQTRLDGIEPLIQTKFNELNQTIDLRRDAGFESALELILTDAGKDTMDDLRVAIAEMEQEERRLLEQRAAATASTVTTTKYAIVFGTLVAAAIFGIIAQFLSRTNSRLEDEVAERKQAEARLEHRAIELDAVNKELESFSYSVSHDLRAPLRSLDGFGQALLEDYSEVLDVQGKDYIHRIRAASQRMGESMHSLLNLAQITRGELGLGRVDLSAIVHSVSAELKTTQPNREAEFGIQDGLLVNGDAQLLRVVIDNLLGNAWKFTGSREVTKIEFGVSSNGSGPVYFVRDNGVGFDMAYVDKLFGAFQRLHGATEFEGMGIGLATVERIVHRHGGKVWAEGDPGAGATFYFTLN